MTRADIEAKFRKGAKGRLASHQADQVVDAITHLEALPSVRTLMGELRAHQPA